MTTLRKALSENKLEAFIKEREPLDAPKEEVARYIDASASPLDSRKEGQSKFYQGSADDCK